MTHIPQIDTLRGIAVLAVLLFHGFPDLFPYGYLGVDAFFVISGFVISRSYLHPLARGTVEWKTFWIKRFRRLAPAYLFCVIVTVPFAYFILEPHLLRKFGDSLVVQPFYLQNVAFWIEGDYFNNALSKPLLHTWSLAIEEQFYVAFMLLVLILRYLSKKILFLLAVTTVAVFSFVLAEKVSGVSPKTAFYLLPFRAWQLLAGVIAYLIVDYFSSVNRLSMVGLVTVPLLLILSFLLFNPLSNLQNIWEYTLLISLLIVALLVLYDLGSDQRSLKFISVPLRGLGTISYSLYLWHWPVLSLLSTYIGRSLGYVESAVSLMVSCILAYLSYRLVELPVRTKGIVEVKKILFSGIAGYSVILMSGLFLIMSDGGLARYPEPQRTWLRVSQERSPYRCSYLSRISDFSRELCPINHASGDQALLIIGDSHADQLDEMIGEIGESLGVRVYLTTRNCDINKYLTKKYCGEDVFFSILDEIKQLNISHVLAISDWSKGAEYEEFERVVSEIQPLYLKVIFSITTPVSEYFNPRKRALRASDVVESMNFTRSNLLAQNSELRGTLEKLKNKYPETVDTIDASGQICMNEGNCSWLEGMQPLFFDDGHLSAFGVLRVKPVYMEMLEKEFSADHQVIAR